MVRAFIVSYRDSAGQAAIFVSIISLKWPGLCRLHRATGGHEAEEHARAVCHQQRMVERAREVQKHFEQCGANLIK